MGSNQELMDETVRWAVNMQRFSESEVKKVTKVLRATQREIISEIASIDPAAPKLTKWTVKRLEKVNSAISDVLDIRYDEIDKVTNTDLKELSSLSGRTAVKHVNKVIGVDLINVTLTTNQLKAIVNETLIDGTLLKEWWKKAKNDTKFRLKGGLKDVTMALQKGLIRGDSVAVLSRKVRDILKTSIREATAIVHTSTMAVSNAARQAIYAEHSDILKGYQVLATLDSATTPLCRSLDGGEYTTDFKPIPPTRVALPIGGTPPYHFRCRTVLLPLTKTYPELMGSRLSKRQKTVLGSVKKREDVGGSVEGRLTYDAWLKKQSKATQVEVLGEKRRELWAKYKLSQADLLHQSGRALTIEELKKRLDN